VQGLENDEEISLTLFDLDARFRVAGVLNVQRVKVETLRQFVELLVVVALKLIPGHAESLSSTEYPDAP